MHVRLPYMHQSSYVLMKRLIEHLRGIRGKILDVGSSDFAYVGNYKSLFLPDIWEYHGLDITAEPNVDIVTKDPYNWPIADETYEVVISGQCLEHVEAPWLWMKEVSRVCKKNGIAIIIAPWACGEHRHPVDCWRIFPDGMKYLMSTVGNFDLIECNKGPIIGDIGDCWGVGRKRS